MTTFTFNQIDLFSHQEVFALLNEQDRMERNIPALVEVSTQMLDQMNYKEAGECELTFDHQELENIHLMLSRLAGVPEPELYQDVSPYLFSGVDQDLLLQVVEIQIRMTYGMEMIEAASAKLEWFSNGHRVPREIFVQWVDRRKKLWTCWHNLRGQCARLVKGDKAVWAAYFQLKDELEDVDQLENWYYEQVASHEEDVFDTTSTWREFSPNEVMEDMLMNEIYIRYSEEEDN